MDYQHIVELIKLRLRDGAELISRQSRAISLVHKVPAVAVQRILGLSPELIKEWGFDLPLTTIEKPS